MLFGVGSMELLSFYEVCSWRATLVSSPWRSQRESPAFAGLPGFVPLWSSSSPVSNRQVIFSASWWGNRLSLSSYRAWSGRFFTNWTGWDGFSPSPLSGSLPSSVPVPARLLVHSRCPSASGLPTAAFPLYILRMNYSSPLLSLMCGGFLVFVFLFSLLIYMGEKPLKTGKPRARARGRSLRRRSEMVWDRAPLGVGCGLPWASSLRASRGPLPITDQASPITVLCILADLDVVLGPFGPLLCALFVRQPDNTITSR